MVLPELGLIVLVLPPVPVIKYPSKSKFKGERIYLYCNSRFKSIVEGRSRHQKLDATPSHPQLRAERACFVCILASVWFMVCFYRPGPI